MIAIFISIVTFIISIVALGCSVTVFKACRENENNISTVVNQAKLDRRVLEGLVQSHEKCVPECCWSLGEYTIYKHKENKAFTSTVSDVTLEELARLVLDGTPIKRDVAEPKEFGIYITEI